MTTVLFALSAVSATRTTRYMGGSEANFWRLCLATVFLAAYAHSFGAGLSGNGFPYFLLSGCIGFGIGDLALFQAYPRLGSRLSIMIVHCLAAPFAALTEWLWLGTTMTAGQILSGLTILTGVAIALSPQEHLHIERRTFITGILFGTLAAIGQGGGAVLSRKAIEACKLAGQNMDGITAAYQRIIAGVVFAGLFLLFLKRQTVTGQAEPPAVSSGEKWRLAWPWIIFNALAGPTLGVSCYQWALQTESTGVVLPIVALTPLVVVPFAAWMEGEKPSRRSLTGGVVAVIGAAALAMARTRH
jgi:drug/metabolite transporter (DMT)-like permease